MSFSLSSLSPSASPLGPLDDTWAPPLPPPGPVPDDLRDALPVLARQGRWRDVASRCRVATATDTPTAMTVASYHLLALLKLDMPAEAAAELAKLGAWDDPSSGLGPTAAHVPFALRRLRAELPWWLGRQQEAVDRLYQLLEWCGKQEAAAAAAGSGGSAGGGTGGGAGAGAGASAQQLWRRRHRDVLLTLVNRHCRTQQYAPALTLLDRLLERDAADMGAWQEAGMVQALLGDVAAASCTLQKVEQMLEAGSSSSSSSGSGGGQAGTPQQQEQWRQGAVPCNRGLLAFLQNDYRGAAQSYQAAMALDPTDAIAANNQALALMYSNHLAEGSKALEAAVRRAPHALLQEPLITNLASMLELGASPASLAAKQRMADWVASQAPDDFDLAATRTVGA